MAAWETGFSQEGLYSHLRADTACSHKPRVVPSENNSHRVVGAEVRSKVCKIGSSAGCPRNWRETESISRKVLQALDSTGMGPFGESHIPRCLIYTLVVIGFQLA